MTALLDWAWNNAVQLSVIIPVGISIIGAVLWRHVVPRHELAAAKSALHKRVDEVLGDVNSLAQRFASIEAKLGLAATKEDVQQVLLALARQDGQRNALEAMLDGVKQRVIGMERPLDLIQEHLLRETRR